MACRFSFGNDSGRRPQGKKRPAVCPVCGKAFTAQRVTQKCCSYACRRYAHRHGMVRHEPAAAGEPLRRAFHCLRCHRLVEVTESRDRRTKFCSAYCERLYWKRPRQAQSVSVQYVFYCRSCGKRVCVASPKDTRTDFCSAACRNSWYARQRRRGKQKSL